MEGTRAKLGNQLVYYICIHLLCTPKLDYASAGCELYTTTQTVSLIISKTNRTVKRHIITCKQLCPVHFSLQQSSHHGFLERLPPDGGTLFKSHEEGAEINICA